ncbi:MAG: putative DNA modification/repair radical SAM protein, partial [Candidatus Hodarchaeales archaeon]
MPSVSEKIEILGAASKYDVCASMASPRKEKGTNRVGNPLPAGICHAYTSDGRCMSLFKVLMTNQCSFDCAYCMNSCTGARKRTMFKPEELARVFMGLYIRNYVEGLFLSSGIMKDVDRTSELMLEGIKLI